ncbi:asparagine synthase-related protein [Sphingomonas sp. OTU376]|uniref:asparagine synthase-related protein n=1 Tax=Sphingomonas sp. OTU376 TaxID=3043863 RepID=UPI00313ABAD3
MTLRYLVVLERSAGGPVSELDPGLSRLGLRQAHSVRGMTIWTNQPDKLLATPSGLTIVLGRIFSRGATPVRVAALDPAFDRRRDLPGHLSTGFWGNYLLLQVSSIGSVVFFRDPGGALPCYVRETPERMLLFSDLGVARAAGITSFAVDWANVAACLFWPTMRTRQTSLEQVYEIPQGWSLGVGGPDFSQLRQIWSPWDHVCASTFADGALREALATTVIGTTRALASDYSSIQLCLSGGLDSSIVATALRGSNVLGLTLVSPGADGDERREAALVADYLGMELVARDYRMEDVDLGRSSAAHLPRPTGDPGRQGFDQAVLEVSEARGTQALFTGFGGDNVFCLMRSATPLADRIRSRSSLHGIWSTLTDVCALTGCSLTTAVRLASTKLPGGATRYRWERDARFLSEDLVAAMPEQPDHPWLEAPQHALAGQAAHISKLIRTQNYAEGLDRTVRLEMINPLLSQPVIELCLSIPTWKWIEGGRDRAVARGAFEKHLPAAIISRRGKGGPSGYYRQILGARFEEIRVLLLQGLLVGNGLIDPKSLEKGMAASSDLDGSEYSRILDLVDAEIWVRQYS